MNPITLNFGLSSSPWLADHGFQGMAVLPGAWWIAAGRAQAEADDWPVSGVHFERPLVLAPEDQAAELRIQDEAEGRKRCEFFVNGSLAAHFRLEKPACAVAGGVDPGGSAFDVASAGVGAPGYSKVDAPSIETPAAVWYAKLSANGNHYGPTFQLLESIAVGDRSARARLKSARPKAAPFADAFVIDAAIQLLAILNVDRGETFVLSSIDELHPGAASLATATMLAADLSGDQQGKVRVMDGRGRVLLQLTGVRFVRLENAPPPLPLTVSANFTVEPIEDALRFWADELSLPITPRFAPYNQVFQELLDPSSASRTNSGGVNLIFLHLGDWLGAAGLPRCADCDTPTWPVDLERHLLPNGMEVAHLNRHETDYVYQEIFADRCYLRHGIRLPPGAVIIDVGANIGLFSLFARTECPDATVYAFEPSPVAFRALEANCRAYGPRLRPFNAGVGGEKGEAALTFYRRSSVFSSFHPNADADRQAIEAVASNVVQAELAVTAEEAESYVRDLTVNRLDAEEFLCPMVGVSDIVREHRLDRIDLLKIDAEKCELEILRGIADADWPRIGQVVVEVHDRTGSARDEVQAILSARGFDCAWEEERLLGGSGLFNVYAVRNRRARPPEPEIESPASLRWHELQAKAAEFERALSAYGAERAPTAVLIFCPSSAQNLGPQDLRQLAVIETRLAAFARDLPSFTVVESSVLGARHAKANWHARAGETAGHLAFTPEGYALLGTAAMRSVSAHQRPPFKAIALDCDQTLWRGVCGEDGALGVVVTPAHRALQEFLLRQMQAGLMLCLCSKNDEADVWAVFDRNPGMVLRREHLAASAIGWEAKSDGLRQLAARLQIAADSFLVLDDNPVEIAEIQARGAGAVPLQLPDAASLDDPFWNHLWPFDVARVTTDDRARTRRMHEAADRDRFLQSAGTLEAFVAGLKLQVSISPPRDSDLPRLSQLTLRTNQFNFTTVRRSEAELRRFLADPGATALQVEARDRFGDYGCVGLVLGRRTGGILRIDTFLLSCRVLGRGIEHQVAAEVGRRAAAAGAAAVEWTLKPSEKNRPAADFAEQLPASARRTEGASTVLACAPAALAAFQFHPEARGAPAAPGRVASVPPRAPAASRFSPEKWLRIAEQEADRPGLMAAIDRHRLWRAGVDPEAFSPDTSSTVPGRLLALWRRVLGNPSLGLDRNFLDAGGSSLKAVQLVAAIRRELGFTVSVAQFFECPTVRALGGRLAAGRSAPAASTEAIERGARRKIRIRRPAP